MTSAVQDAGAAVQEARWDLPFTWAASVVGLAWPLSTSLDRQPVGVLAEVAMQLEAFRVGQVLDETDGWLAATSQEAGTWLVELIGDLVLALLLVPISVITSWGPVMVMDTQVVRFNGRNIPCRQVRCPTPHGSGIVTRETCGECTLDTY